MRGIKYHASSYTGDFTTMNKLQVTPHPHQEAAGKPGDIRNK